MAIIVDKVQKRKDIALSCKQLVLDKGIKNITISEMAKTAGVGKGTLYDYFKSKEDVVFEIVNILLVKHNETKEKDIAALHSTKEKVKIFFKFFYDEQEYELREIYKEFIAIALTSPEHSMTEFHLQCSIRYHTWFETIIQTGIDAHEIIPDSKKLVKGLYVLAEGLFISGSTTGKLENLEVEINNHIDAIFELIKVK